MGRRKKYDTGNGCGRNEERADVTIGAPRGGSGGDGAGDDGNDRREVYAFPTRSRCPRCGSLNTVARKTELGKQYRECRMAVCRLKYCVIGTRIEEILGES